ncbi:MAG: DNA polymerase, partial [Coriobacteriia bacterium]|nr:DNA polymerase [Coriobacteriia bacterium]
QENNVDKTSIADMQAQTAVASAYPALESLPGNIPNQPLSYLSGAEARQSLQGYLQKGSVFSLVIEDSPGQASFFDTNETELYCLVEDKLLNLGEILSTETSTALAELYCQAELLIAFDHKALLGYLMPRDTTVAAAIDYAEVDPTRLFDCSLAAYLIDSTMVPGSLRALLERYPALADEAAEVQEQLAALPRLAAQMLQQLIADNALECYETIEKPLIAVLAQMERTGVRIDREMLAALNRTVTADLEDLRREAIEAAGEEFNLDSPKQLGVILFEKLKLPTAKKTRTGYSTDASVLEDLKPLHALPGLMLAYRELAKLKSTYLDALPRLVKADGKIHTTFNQTVTATGRLSSTDPNLQNIPVRTELGRQIRLAFVPDGASFAGVAGMGAGAAVALAAVAPGAAPAAAPAAVAPAAAASVKPLSHTAVPREAVLLGADYSQIELRILAHCSEDPGLVQSFIAGEDFHTMTASQVWSVDPADVTPELRNRAKAVNFGIVYGQQAYGLAQSLGVPYQDAQFLINRYFATFPGVRDYLDKTVAIARSQGWVETIFGRRRYLKDLFSSNASRRSFADRTAMNHPMQGSAADIIKLAMVEVMNRIVADGYAAELLLQVHDELMFNCAADEAASLGEMVKQTMEAACELKVPLVADINVGSNWAEAH